MNNQTIRIGIDLGTANSKIAINLNGKIEIIKKPGGVEYTPSVFGFDKSGKKVVGQNAYEHLYKFNEKGDNENFKAEIKRLMGTPKRFEFPRGKVKMTPEEISAEILKSLKEDLLKKYPDFDATTAVITVPAAFSVLQSEATKRAGNLAGFKHVILLQEPIAAAVSYGFMNAKNENWLIYDFGGGTFDLAIVSCKDGVLSVLGHEGEEFLGGKDIDWTIVKSIIVPRILERYKFTNFDRSNAKYEQVYARLKYFAEVAKIELSQYTKTTIEIDEIGKDEQGKEIILSIVFTRSELNKLIETMVTKTIEMANNAIKEAGLKNSAIKRIILVGGTTLIPYIRERLQSDLKITVDSSVDPLTVVASGACIFAISQKIPKEFLEENTKKVRADAHKIVLNYTSLTSDTEESVTGSIDGLNGTKEYFVQIQSNSGDFTGPKVKVNKGKFFYTVKVAKNKENLYWIYLFDDSSNNVKVSPESFTITYGLSVAGAPLPHSIQVVVAKQKTNVWGNLCEPIFNKGDILPLKKTIDDYKTSRMLKKGEDSSLDIEIVEGEMEIPDRNLRLCKLEIRGKDLPYDLPAGTPIELTIEMNESRELSAIAYIPLIDVTAKVRWTIRDEEIDTNVMVNDLDIQRKRAAVIFENCSEEEKKKISDSIQSVSEGINNADIDEDEKRKADKELKNLKSLLDNMEEEKKITQLIKEYNLRVQDLQKVINEYADPKERDEDNKQLEEIKIEGQRAINENNKILLIRKNEELANLRQKAVYSNPNAWVAVYRQIVAADHFINEQDAQYYILKCSQAIEARDWEELKRCVVQLNLLRPIEEQKKTDLSGITR